MPAILCWALLLLLAVPALALAQAEAPPAEPPVLVEDPAALDQYGTLPPGEQEISFEPTPVSPAPSAVETPPVTPAPVDPVTDPAPVDPIPTDPVGEEPAPTDPVGEEPIGEVPVDQPPVGSVIDNSPEQEPGDTPAYTPPVVAFPPVDIPIAAATPLPTEVIPTQDLVRQAEAQVPTAETAAPTTAAPISRPIAPVTRATAIPSPFLSAPRPSDAAPKPETPFSTGADLVRSVSVAPAATPKLADEGNLPGAGVTDDEALNLYQARLVSPMGPAPSGAQFFEVLAQYAMAGGSGPPTGVALLLLVQVFTVVAAFALRTPRSMFQMILGVSDRACVGYRAVSLRPG